MQDYPDKAEPVTSRAIMEAAAAAVRMAMSRPCTWAVLEEARGGTGDLAAAGVPAEAALGLAEAVPGVAIPVGEPEMGLPATNTLPSSRRQVVLVAAGEALSRRCLRCWL